MTDRYTKLLAAIFDSRYRQDGASFEFDRAELETAAARLGVALPKNLGDVLYAFRYRRAMPKTIAATAPEGLTWIIEPAGKARYRFRLAKLAHVISGSDLLAVKIPDATPEIVAHYALSDEQALLARVRYNRLIDVFLGVTAYSLQSHLRTSVSGLGQIEIDELYVGLDKTGRQYVVPVEAKGGSEWLATVQTGQNFPFAPAAEIEASDLQSYSR